MANKSMTHAQDWQDTFCGREKELQALDRAV